MLDPRLIAFAGAVGVLTLVPGADTMLVMRNVMARGRTAGFATSFGIGTGLFAQAILSALGLSAILMGSAALFSAVKLAGALYLAGLGVWTIVTARRSRETSEEITPAPVQGGAGRSYVEGVLTNLLNPKIVVFYLAFLPQFIGPADPVLTRSVLLAGIHFVLTIAWLSTLTVALNRLSTWVSRPSVRGAMDYFTGTVLVALGIRLALER